MDAPITLQLILTILGVLAAIVAGVGAVIVIIRWITGAHDKMQKWDSLEQVVKDQQIDTNAKLQQIRTEQCMMTDAMLAVLEGLMQLNCNGPVTEAHTTLTKYLNDQAHEPRR